MAKRKVNKTAAIKAALTTNPMKKPKEIAELVSKSGIKVTPLYVSNIKSAMGKKKKPSAAKKHATSIGTTNGHAQHVEAFMFVQKVGSLTAAKKLLEDFSVLVS